MKIQAIHTLDSMKSTLNMLKPKSKRKSNSGRERCKNAYFIRKESRRVKTQSSSTSAIRRALITLTDCNHQGLEGLKSLTKNSNRQMCHNLNQWMFRDNTRLRKQPLYIQTSLRNITTHHEHQRRLKQSEQLMTHQDMKFSTKRKMNMRLRKKRNWNRWTKISPLFLQLTGTRMKR